MIFIFSVLKNNLMILQIYLTDKIKKNRFLTISKSISKYLRILILLRKMLSVRFRVNRKDLFEFKFIIIQSLRL